MVHYYLDKIIDYKKIFEKLPGNYTYLKYKNKKFYYENISDEIVNNYDEDRKKQQGEEFFSIVSIGTTQKNIDILKSGVKEIIKTKLPFKPSVIRYDMKNVETYWDLEFTPILNSKNDIIGLLIGSVDVTDLIKSMRKKNV